MKRPSIRTSVPKGSSANDDSNSELILDLLPDQANIDRITKQAEGYIPEAAASITSLIYRQRGAGALELKDRLGVAGTILAPIIKSNIETIASPGREKDLLRLEAYSQQMKAGPLLAPQFTIASSR